MSWVGLGAHSWAKLDPMDHIFQVNYQKQQPHPLKGKTGDDCNQSDGCANAKGERGSIPQMFYAWIDTVVCPSIPSVL
ncbi:hypothetical protein GXM_08888 [Nostoc sphaeroides CCNUC1]|uniref:Uncharacterized protein n=1 Tax=Nostoc sphaeroides CCNUC1 TaxID=2653204 RepID=A0A5P8WFE0_9NOSO|nr:hypothetical protein GXM_08888 [Nostoc sphaeroides CCNUC1]